ncbi:AarF/ABC1/UbiB kinase family protein [Methanobacterium sp. CWC-01]|uniref:ABC1 kinase family protein n=1 Tax=Methanobacterium aridiramus TaxID=2584467 RepID=UPI002576AF13|nr:AarF/ABC1/UbiB kinase family protein [Methanobacterium sp. CWC-01]WJI08637.1 AarF/ABC1/UbiB kinase family protein [Methanobacterium sp. CWC-01]
MSVPPFGNSKPDLKRVRGILGVLSKYRFGNTLMQLGFRRKLSPEFLLGGDLGKELDNTAPSRFRAALEELGTTYIKLGQVLSTRPDLVGMEIADELSRLQDDVPPVPFSEIKAVVEEELGSPLEELFQEFEEKSIASASIAQVHKARLMDGTEVAVKVQKRGIIDIIKQDVAIMRYLAQQADTRIRKVKYYNFPGIVDEFERTIRRELDFAQEARNIERFRTLFEGDEKVSAPEVYRDYSTSKVLTMEFIHGTKISELLESDEKISGKTIALVGTECYFKQIFMHGFFHADPHPGNIMVLPGNRLCFVDFGMTGHLEREFRDDLAELFIYTAKYDVKGIINQMVYMRMIDEDSDLEHFKYTLMDLLDQYYGAEIKDVGGMITEFSMPDVVSEHQLKLPRDFILLGRVLSMAEDLGRKLDPNFNGIEVAEPMIRKLLKGRLNPLRWRNYQVRYLFETEHLLKDLPQTINRILMRAEDGRIKMEIEHKELDEFSLHLEKITNRVALALIISSLIIGSSLIMQSDKGMPMPGIGFSTIGSIIFLVGAALAIGFSIAILRKFS